MHGSICSRHEEITNSEIVKRNIDDEVEAFFLWVIFKKIEILKIASAVDTPSMLADANWNKLIGRMSKAPVSSDGAQ